MRFINFGFIGTGSMAATMMEAVRHVENVRVVAVASGSQDRARSFATAFNIPKAYGNVIDLLKDQSIDAVYVVNLTELHADTTIRALQAGKAVLSEKPIATSEADSRRIQEVATETGKLCMEAMWTHFLPAYQALFKINESQSIGYPTQLYADFGYPADEESHPRIFKPSAGSGVLLDRGVYPIALAVKLFGHVKRIKSQVICNAAGVDTDACIILHHENGCLSQLGTSVRSLQQNCVVLSFTEGAAVLEPPAIVAETLTVQRSLPHQASTESSRGLKATIKQMLKQSAWLRNLHSRRKLGTSEFLPFGKNQYAPVITHFCSLIEQGKLESDVVPLRFSREVLRVVDSVRAPTSPVNIDI